jgi:hypothetical protein
MEIKALLPSSRASISVLAFMRSKVHPDGVFSRPTAQNCSGSDLDHVGGRSVSVARVRSEGS